LTKLEIRAEQAVPGSEEEWEGEERGGKGRREE
jgi:hypothetical protein